MKVNAYAKLNLSLQITGQKDGCHLLDTVMQEIDLADELELQKTETLSISCTGAHLPEKNTLRTAAELFFTAAQIDSGAAIQVHKHIPSMAGLGGGSSDGTAVLKALNILYGNPLPDAQLRDLAVRIGADCSFFLKGGIQRAQGFGEILTPVTDALNLQYLLVKPEEGVSTKTAFSLADSLPPVSVPMPRILRAIRQGDVNEYEAAAGNALQPAALRLVPSIARAGEACQKYGARFWLMSGSGSCIFAVFPDEEQLRTAEAALIRDGWPFVYAARPVRHGYI